MKILIKETFLTDGSAVYALHVPPAVLAAVDQNAAYAMARAIADSAALHSLEQISIEEISR